MRWAIAQRRARVDSRARQPLEISIAAFRFIHTADLHLDSPLKSLALREPALAALVGDATRAALRRIVDLCLSEAVDALLIAGDLYDGEQTSMKTARFLGEQMKRLSEAGVRVFIIRGNHDAMSRITRELTLPESCRIFGGRAGVEMIERPGTSPIAIHGLSFAEPVAPQGLLPKYRPAVPDAVNIGLMHTSLGGSPGHSVYAPCTLAELRATGFRYWALGHIHGRSVDEGPVTVVMPGMPQGRDIGEGGSKSVTLAVVGDDGALALEERVVGPVAFWRISVEVAGAEDIRSLVRRAARALADAAARNPAAGMIARLRLTGRSPLAWRIRRDLDWIKAEIELELGAGRGLWIESLDTEAREPAAGPPPGGPAAELARLAAADVLTAEGFQAMARELADEFVRRQLPGELRGMIGDDEALAAAAVAGLAREGVDDVLARLMAEDAGEAG
jgi:DNA repair exonuclease SbcCD nuclease subunit